MEDLSTARDQLIAKHVPEGCFCIEVKALAADGAEIALAGLTNLESVGEAIEELVAGCPGATVQKVSECETRYKVCQNPNKERFEQAFGA